MSAFGHLTIFLALKANRASLHLRPENTQAALIYHAAQMIAGGTTFQTGEVCGTPFFSGGPGCEKRARVRFCGYKCRWTHHNNKKVRLKTYAVTGTPIKPTLACLLDADSGYRIGSKEARGNTEVSAGSMKRLRF